jgi:dTDP-4-dehydrorhamnose reductase
MSNKQILHILVLGANGMLGNAVLRWFSRQERFHVVGSVRHARGIGLLQPLAPAAHLVAGVDVENLDSLTRLFATARPDVVINCIGLIKQLAEADDPLSVLPLNALLPHRLELLSRVAGARLVHVSTDCVFSGSRGNYHESDRPDAEDLYGRSKLLGEVTASASAITLRTSIIGHELGSAHALVDWFLSQKAGVNGYAKAFFSGVPTVELARIIDQHVLPDPGLAGLYHVSADPIDKCSLLQLVAREYGHGIPITPSDEVKIDRSLDSSRFRDATGYRPDAWPELVRRMREFA